MGVLVMDPETASGEDILRDEIKHLAASLDDAGQYAQRVGKNYDALWALALTLVAAVRRETTLCLACSRDLDHALRAVEEFASERRPS